MFRSGDDVLTMYEVYVSGQDEDGPDARTIGDDANDLLIRGGILNLKYSCCEDVEAMNDSDTFMGVLRLMMGGFMETPQGATTVSTGMFIFGYQCCW